MPMKTVHCRLCGKAIKGRNFAERMAKLRHHRKQKHPTAHKRSVAKAMVTKGYDRKWRKRARLDPEALKARRGLIKKPKVEAYTDHKASGLIRILERQEGTLFPEFALYAKSNRKLLTESLKDAGLKEEAKGKWVLRTNKFNIFVYLGDEK